MNTHKPNDQNETTLAQKIRDTFLVTESEWTDNDIDPPDRVTMKEFHRHLSKVAEAAHRLSTLSSDLRVLRATGLRDSDVVDLLYARNTAIRKGDAKAVMDAVDDLSERLERANPAALRMLLVRIISDMTKLNLKDVREVLGELDRLHKQYGSDVEDDR